LGIHDISRTEVNPDTRLPRFNMPFELGLFLGAKRFGPGKQKAKKCLILDTEAYRYQRFLSDIAGQDIHAHKGQIAEVVKLVRNWLNDLKKTGDIVPSGSIIAERYDLFRSELPDLCRNMRLRERDLTFSDFIFLVEEWLKLNALVDITE
jgi:hypothetical protein